MANFDSKSFPKDIREKILDLFSKKPDARLTPAQILRRAALGRVDLQLVLDALRHLSADGRLVRLRKNHYALPHRQNLFQGRVHAHPDGYGFLIREDRSGEDIYLHRREMRRVLHGDKVLVRLDRRARGGSDARIIRVIERAQSRVVGTYDELQGRGFLVPMDARIGAIALKDAGVKPEPGKVVAAEISRYGTALSAPEAVLAEVLGDPDDPEVQARSLIFRYGLSAEFSPEAEREAGAIPWLIEVEEIAARADLRNLPILTIDGERARDFDDAVYARRTDGGYELLVSIADVARYVVPGSAIDQEAYARATSVYFPDRAIAMLPEKLSNGVCSLNPHEDRLTKTVSIEFNARGEVLGSRVFNSVIRSRERMTYTDVRRMLVDRDSEALARYAPLTEQFKLMEELALLLCETRRVRGNLDFDLPEAEIILDLQGAPENIVRAERNLAHRMIEEFMIAANEAVARHLKQRNVPLLYRVHEGPDPEALGAIAPFLLSLGYRLPQKKGKLAPAEIQKILEAARGQPEERVVHRVLLRSMKQALYQPENIGHFGLASTCYAHFTSPIRRYPDLIVHRMLDRAATGEKLKSRDRDALQAYLEEAGKHVSERERHAMEAEREMIDLKKAQFMMNRLGEEFTGFITSLTNFGFFVELDDYFVEGLVKLSSLADDDYHYYEKDYVIKGRRRGRTFRLGNQARVKAVRVNAFRGEIDFEIIGDGGRIR